ncbi:uncharacterized protein DS421_19g652970 [Arachis hypogaea]|uniref:Uncharacterized protein n=2 Tax=Arachis hypogaea TaxID=3818 RepID=A0A6B9V9V0_ARAHY|nr:uncharacterized protein DS421_19g652970 [Arachis hypogaea]
MSQIIYNAPATLNLNPLISLAVSISILYSPSLTIASRCPPSLHTHSLSYSQFLPPNSPLPTPHSSSSQPLSYSLVGALCFCATVIHQVAMEFVNRIVESARKASNNNTVINVCLAASFMVLAGRSFHQQKIIEALETEKASLVKSNKDIKRTLWNWKQQLYAEAASDDALVPLHRLKAIYGETPHSTAGDAVNEDANSSSLSKFVA